MLSPDGRGTREDTIQVSVVIERTLNRTRFQQSRYKKSNTIAHARNPNFVKKTDSWTTEYVQKLENQIVNDFERFVSGQQYRSKRKHKASLLSPLAPHRRCHLQ